MKLIKQAILSFREGRSDKVYEVDLCQVGPDQYVVNFRYGRRGAALRDGSKTVVAVPYAEAERIFDQLVAEKVKKGYRHQSQSETPTLAAVADMVSATDGPAKTGVTTELGPREQAVLDALRAHVHEKRGHTRKLDRLIWRAGELGLHQAEPLLCALWGKTRASELMRRYCLVWALGRCGGQAAIALLEPICDDPTVPEHIRRMALEGLRRLYPEEQRAALIEAQIGRLPAFLAELARTGPASAVAAELRGLVERDRSAGMQALERAYLIDSEHVRPAVLELVRELPLERGYFDGLRQIFKLAEHRRDGRIFGLLAYRFETSPALRGHHQYRQRDISTPFQEPTRRYLRRRAWRILRHLGADESPDFVKMAVGVLLPFTDANAGQPKHRRIYRWRQPDVDIHWDTYASYWAFNHLLYGKSARYRADENGRAFRCIERYRPGAPAPSVREEAYPRLWERTPAALLHLLDESRCARVHEFAVKVLRACPAFLTELDVSAAVMLLSRSYDITVWLGVEVARRLYDAGALPIEQAAELVTAMLECQVEPVRSQARNWIDTGRYRLLEDTAFVAALVASSHVDNREYARNLLRARYMSEDTARVLIGRLLATIQALGPEQEERIADICSTLLACFRERMSTMGWEVMADLLAHPSQSVQALAGDVILSRTQLASSVPDRVLAALLGSPHLTTRAAGSAILDKLTDAELVARTELLLILATHEHEDLRLAAHRLIRRMVALSPSAAAELAGALAEALLHKAAKGVHTHVLMILKDALRPYLHVVGKDRIWQLLRHKHPQAQELGGVLLGEHLGPDDLSVAEIVQLASHEILAVRQGAWAMCEKALDRLKRTMPVTVRLLDAAWADSRAFAMGFFRERLTEAELTPDILVAICDSVRPEIQQFGRELITRYFRDGDGYEYLVKLSEHPGEGLQLFASNYLEGYAAGSVERLRALEPYFVAVLSRVNRGRIAKDRCIAFLRQQALASAEAAQMAARVFARQSATMAIGDKEALIAAMVDIARAHPGVDLPIRNIDIPHRGPGGGSAEARDGV